MSTAPERDLLLANPSGNLDAQQCKGSIRGGFESSHRAAVMFDRSMSLLGQIVQVLFIEPLSIELSGILCVE
jgi:hypothetical protein